MTARARCRTFAQTLRSPLAATFGVVAVLALACGRRHFEYRDTRGRVCSPFCHDGVTTCTDDLDCDEPSPADCSKYPGDHPCWLLAGAEVQGFLVDPMALCEGCCVVQGEFPHTTFGDTCKPLLCDEGGLKPPLPMVCHAGYVLPNAEAIP